MEDTEQLERNWDSPGSFLQPFRGGLPSGVIAAALAAAESPQSVPLPPRPPKLPRGPGAHPVGQQAADVTPPPSELPSARSEEPKSSFLTAGLLSKMMGFEPIPITDDIGMNDSLSYSMTMTKSLGSSWH